MFVIEESHEDGEQVFVAQSVNRRVAVANAMGMAAGSDRIFTIRGEGEPAVIVGTSARDGTAIAVEVAVSQ